MLFRCCWVYCWVILLTNSAKLIRSISVELLLELLTETTVQASSLTQHKLSKNVVNQSIISERCDNYDDSIKSRIGCCYPNDAKLLYNVMIEKQRLLVFLPKGNKRMISNEELKLPPIKSLQKQATSLFNMEVEVRYDDFPSSLCKSVYNGTLHVIGRSSANNVYHASKYIYCAFPLPHSFIHS